jgi:hypothetical protein
LQDKKERPSNIMKGVNIPVFGRNYFAVMVKISGTILKLPPSQSSGTCPVLDVTPLSKTAEIHSLFYADFLVDS